MATQETIRQRIVNAITKWIKTNGNMPLRLLKSVLKEAGIPGEAYEKIKPKAWISTSFPEFFIVGTHGLEQIWIAEPIVKLLVTELAAKGMISLPGVAILLEKAGIDWKQHANNKKLSVWLQESYGKYFTMSEDKCWLYPVDADTFSSYASAKKATLQPELNYVYQYCSFSSDFSILKQFKELTADENLETYQCRQQCTVALSQSLLGLNGGMLDDSKGEIPRMAFYTGIKTFQKQEIYGILLRNNDPSTVQDWVFSTIAFPGQDTEEGQWLCNTFNIAPQDSYCIDKTESLRAINDTLNSLREKQEALLSEFAHLQNCIEDGRELPPTISAELNGYLKGWKKLKKALSEADLELSEEELNVSSVQKQLDQFNDANKVKEELSQKFSTLVQDTLTFLKENMLCQQDLTTNDISSWNNTLQQFFDSEKVYQLRKQLEPFRALAVLRAFDPASGDVIGEAEYQAIEVVNEHFKTSLRPNILKHSICNRDVDMSFLEELPEIESLIQLINNKNKKKQQQYTEDHYDDSFLLDAALSHTLWPYVNVAYSKPNPLEQAAMLGNLETIHEYVNDIDKLHTLGYEPDYEELIIENSRKLQFTSEITPTHAAERLYALMGASCRMIDRCLLIGIMQKDEGAVESLIKHYIRTDRPQLASKLYDESSSQLPSEIRRELMPQLLSADCISIEETLQSDILSLMTEEGISFVRSNNMDSKLQEKLLDLYEKIKPTLIHHIVFLSPELQSYVLRPENSGELKTYLIDLSNSGMVDLLRQNAFTRGTSPLLVAKRIYEFIGNWENLSLEFALLSPESDERQALLFDIYSSQRDDEKMLALLRENPRLKQMHLSYCVDLLFNESKYDEIYEEAAGATELSAKAIMQTVIAAVHVNKAPEHIPCLDASEAVKYSDILVRLGTELARVNKQLHKELLLNVFSCALIELQDDALKRLVTADGELSHDDLYALAKAATESSPALTAYCNTNLNIVGFELESEAYLKKRLDELYDSENEDPLAMVKIISGLLDAISLPPAYLPQLLQLLDERQLIIYAPLYQQLSDKTRDNESKVMCLSLMHKYREKGNDAFRIFLCEQYIFLEKNDLLPDTVDQEAEKLLLDHLDSIPGKDAQRCVLSLEQKAGRKTFADFAEYIIDHDLLYNTNAKKTSDTTEAELSYLCDALEDDDNEITDYLAFCSSFLRLTNDLSSSNNDSEISDSLYCIRSLYVNPADEKQWESLEKLIPQDRVKARARALYHYAYYQGKDHSDELWRMEKKSYTSLLTNTEGADNFSSNNSDEPTSHRWNVGKAHMAWENCVLYCIKENEDEIFFQAAKSWLANINEHYRPELPLYSIKHYVSTMQNILESADPLLQSEQTMDFPLYSDKHTRALISELIATFKKAELDKDNEGQDHNHACLRVIVEWSVRWNCEDILLEKLVKELTGVYVNLGLAFICRMLLAGKTGLIKPFLSYYATSSVKEINYSPLVLQLSKMNDDELTTWLADEINRATLKFILPNGNRPDLVRLQGLVMSCFNENNAQDENVCASVIENLLECYPLDTLLYKSLFIVCKEHYTENFENLQRIHRALIGMFKYYPKDGYKQFTRSQQLIISMIVILRHVMEVMGCPVNETETATELLRGYFSPYKGYKGSTNVNDLISQLNQTTNDLKSRFIGVSMDTVAFSLLLNSCMGAVTGNWVPFIKSAYDHRESAYNYRVQNWITLYPVLDYNKWGLLRSILRVWRDLPSNEEREKFVEWVESPKTNNHTQKLSSSNYTVINFFANLVRRIQPDTVNWNILRLPWEEHMVSIGNLSDANRLEKTSCYKLMMAERPKGKSARDSFLLMLYLAQDHFKVQLLFKSAQNWFQARNYALAGAAYDALNIKNDIPTRDKNLTNAYHEIYETWMRISYCLADTNGNPRNCSAHSCMNMMVGLINQGHADQFDRLSSFFKGTNLKLFYAVRRILSSSLNENEILDMALNFADDPKAEIAFLRFLLSKDSFEKFLFLPGVKAEDINRVKHHLKDLESNYTDPQKPKYWLELKIRPSISLFAPLDDDLEDWEDSDEEDWDSEDSVEENPYDGEKEVSKPEAEDMGFIPRFVSEIEQYCLADDKTQNVQKLIDEYGELTIYNDVDHTRHLQLAAMIYSWYSKKEKTAGIEQAIVRFGEDYCKYHRSLINKRENVAEDRDKIRQALLDLAVYGLNTPTVNSKIISILPFWFQYNVQSFTTIEGLLEDYSLNRNGYLAIAQLLSDTNYSVAINGLFEEFNKLLSISNRLGTPGADIRGYQSAQAELIKLKPEIEFDWEIMFSNINEMFRQAINKLNLYPVLKVTIFNDGCGLQNDGLYGEIENTGREAAFNIEIQASFPENEAQPVSAIYQFPILRPNDKATFAVNYRTNEGVTELKYALNLSYSDKDTRHADEPVQGILTLSPNIQTPTIFPKFNTETALSFTVNEEGEIVSRDFKGRKHEINQLTNLLEGDEFSYYRSAILQGIKRSGKSSLLNYLRTFIETQKGDNTIPIFFDCQNVNKQYIYTTFFKPILEKLPIQYPPVRSHSDWSNFVSKWNLKEGESDRDAGDLSTFFCELHQMLDGKGVYLIIDEFAVMLQRLNEEKGYDDLLMALRSLQMDQDCFASIHLLLCGANHLLIYNQTGSLFNQMFQSYELIPVGQMLTADIQDMILSLLEQHPDIRFAKGKNGGISPSIQWIERYTGGLVWYTRLLVNESIKKVLLDHRNCVYPSDVCAAFHSICTFNNCRQLTEGCDEKDELVLDAIQSLSDNYRTYVSFEQLLQLLNSYMSKEQLLKSLSLLTDSIQILEQKAPHIKNYRFRKELYRRYFRSRDNRFTASASDDGDVFIISTADSTLKFANSSSEFDDLLF